MKRVLVKVALIALTMAATVLQAQEEPAVEVGERRFHIRGISGCNLFLELNLRESPSGKYAYYAHYCMVSACST